MVHGQLKLMELSGARVRVPVAHGKYLLHIPTKPGVGTVLLNQRDQTLPHISGNISVKRGVKILDINSLGNTKLISRWL